MSVVVCPVLPFPNISWWSFIAGPGVALLLDEEEHFEKMSFRNKYFVAGADGVITLSIPLSEGRQQRKAMKEVGICNDTRWQQQHWRTLVSVYNRSPYFEHYAPLLQPLFETTYESLTAFNKAGILMLKDICGFKNPVSFANGYHKHYTGNHTDTRSLFRTNRYLEEPGQFRPYYQTFADRHGFLPNLSILDLLFSEGPNAMALIS